MNSLYWPTINDPKLLLCLVSHHLSRPWTNVHGEGSSCCPEHTLSSLQSKLLSLCPIAIDDMMMLRRLDTKFPCRQQVASLELFRRVLLGTDLVRGALKFNGNFPRIGSVNATRTEPSVRLVQSTSSAATSTALAAAIGVPRVHDTVASESQALDTAQRKGMRKERIEEDTQIPSLIE